jgi:hypothetical protein
MVVDLGMALPLPFDQGTEVASITPNESNIVNDHLRSNNVTQYSQDEFWMVVDLISKSTKLYVGRKYSDKLYQQSHTNICIQVLPFVKVFVLIGGNNSPCLSKKKMSHSFFDQNNCHDCTGGISNNNSGPSMP